MTVHNFVSFAGMFVLLGIAWACSAHHRTVNWRVLCWGVALQIVFAIFVFRVPAGIQVFEGVNDAVVILVDKATAGAHFLFGRLALPPGTTNAQGEESLGFILAFQGFPAIVFFSALMALLYYVKLMPLILKGFARAFTSLMRVSGAESLCVASNIFVGVESTLTVRPHLERMTHSELCTVLTAGMATVASNVLTVYVFSLRSQFPNIAGHLVSASILSAPAALVMSKLILPETGTPVTLGKHVDPYVEPASSLFEAIIKGAQDGMRLIFGIVALLLAVLGLVAVLDGLLGWGGGKLNGLAGWNVDWTLKGLLGYVFYPLTLVLGVAPSDAAAVARVVGGRTVVTELTAYQDLAELLRSGALQHPRSAVIAAYALCGFAHVASLGIFVGGVTALVPSRTSDVAKVGLRALLAATLACLMTACVAGFLLTDTSVSVLLGSVASAPVP